VSPRFANCRARMFSQLKGCHATAGSTHCNRRFWNAARRNAAYALQACLSPPVLCSTSIRVRHAKKSGRRLRGICAAVRAISRSLTQSNEPQRPMVYDPTVVSPTSLEEVYELLAERGRRAKIIAGGTDLMVGLNAKSLAAKEFIDIWRLNDLRGIDDEGETIRIGALTTYTRLIRSPLIQLSVPTLVEASRTIGAIQIQN